MPPWAVAEELGFEQRFGNRAAVDRHERAVRAAAVGVESAGDERLAGAALAGHEDRAVGVGDLFDEGQCAREQGALADDVVELAARLELGFQLPVLAAQTAVVDRFLGEPADDLEARILEGLLENPEGAGTQRFDGTLRRVVPGHDDAGQIGVVLVDPAHELEAGDPRHLDVAEDEVDSLGADDLHRLAGVPRERHRITRPKQDAFERVMIEHSVVDDEDPGLLQGVHSALRRGHARSRRGPRRRPSSRASDRVRGIGYVGVAPASPGRVKPRVGWELPKPR